MGIPKFETIPNVKTFGLIIRLTRVLWSAGKSVVLDIGVCVLKGLLEEKKRGVYGSALIKKSHYWPRRVHRDDIKIYFRSNIYW